MISSATKVFGKDPKIAFPLKAADWYALVFETADRLRQGLAMKEYEALHYADRWLRGYGAGNG